MQAAFKQGLITYPRSNDKAISEESVACIQESAKIFGFDLKKPVFNLLDKTNIHQAPCLTPKGVDVLKKHKIESSNNAIFYTLKKIALLQLRAGIAKQVKRVKTEGINLPEEFDWIKHQNWQREQYDNHYINSISGLFDDYKSSAYNAYDEDKAIIKTMQKTKLATPATQVDNTQRFIKLNLYNSKKLKLTPKGEGFIYKIENQHNTESVNTSDAVLNVNEQREQDQGVAIAKSVDAIIGSKNRKKLMTI